VPRRRNPINVLVVDDESVLAEMVSMALRYEGWNIATAGRIAAIASAAPTAHVVVLDVMLPDMTGWTSYTNCAKRIRSCRCCC